MPIITLQNITMEILDTTVQKMNLGSIIIEKLKTILIC